MKWVIGQTQHTKVVVAKADVWLTKKTIIRLKQQQLAFLKLELKQQ